MNRIAIVLFLMLIAGIGLGQEVPNIRHFTPKDYQFQNQNWDLSQAPVSGWMYFANNGGLLEFDGATWNRFTLDYKQPLRTVAAGQNGLIYGGGFAEFGYWEKQANGELLYQSLGEQARSDLFEKEEIWHIVPGNNFVLFQSFSTIYKFSGGKVTVLKAPGAIMFAQNIAGGIKVPVIGQGIFELLPDNTFRLLPGTEMLKDNIVQFVTEGPSGSLWIGTANDGLFEWKNNTCRPWENPLNKRFCNNQLNRGIRLSDGGWAIGTVLDGVYVLDSLGQIRFALNRAAGLQNNTVLALCEDRNHNLWIGLDKGIDLVELNAPVRYFTDQTGRIGTVYSAILQKNRLYIGANQGLFSRVGNSAFELVNGTQGQVWELREFDGQVLCGHNSGTFRIENGHATKISSITGGWCIIPMLHQPGILVQSTYTGLVIFSKNADGKWTFSHKVAGFEGPIKKIIFDSLGYLWGVHPNKGLYRLRLSDDLKRIAEYRTYTKEDHLPTDHQLDLETMAGKVLLNTHKGIFEIAISGDEIFFQPWPGSVPGTKYISGNSGDYFLVSRSKVSAIGKYGKTEIALSLVPEYERIISLTDSSYLCCIENGFAVLDTRPQISMHATVSAPIIRRVASLSGPVVATKNPFRLAYSENTVHFQFAISSYGRAPLFSWQLDGFTKEWSSWQSAPFQSFINLPAGRYTFRVKTDQNDLEATCTFIIAPPWYQSPLAWVGYAVLVMLLFVVMEMVNRQRIRRHKDYIEAEKEKEIERRRMATEHEKLAFEVENKTRELSNAAFNLIRKNEALQHLKDTLSEHSDDPNIKHKINRMIDEHLEGDHDWEVFEEAFNRVHDNFFIRLMRDFPDMTQGDLRLAAYLRMNLSSKEIAPLLNMSLRGVENKRYRLRKKLGLPETANLAEYLINF